MNIMVIGAGYVGLTVANGLAEVGHNIFCIEKNRDKLAILTEGVCPIYEEGMQDLLSKNINNQSISFYSDIREVKGQVDVIYVAVGTPSSATGDADLSFVEQVIAEICKYIHHNVIVVMKSTVPIGTGERLYAQLQCEFTKKNLTVSYVSNPEFLKEGTALDDFRKPERVVLGSESENAIGVMKEINTSFVRQNDRFVEVSISEAELIKYTSNAFLATKISFMNEIAGLADQFNCDINEVRKGVGFDSRISSKFLYAGCGYGGSCFPKDIKGMIAIARNSDLPMRILNSVEAVNAHQKELPFIKLKSVVPNEIESRTISVWGAAFKPNTDDIREAPVLRFIQMAIDDGFHINIYDPCAMDNLEKWMNKNNYTESVTCFSSAYDALVDSVALVVLTEWREFRSPDWRRIRHALDLPIIIDGRNIYDPIKLSEFGFIHRGIGVGNSERIYDLVKEEDVLATA